MGAVESAFGSRPSFRVCRVNKPIRMLLENLGFFRGNIWGDPNSGRVTAGADLIGHFSHIRELFVVVPVTGAVLPAIIDLDIPDGQVFPVCVIDIQILADRIGIDPASVIIPGTVTDGILCPHPFYACQFSYLGGIEIQAVDTVRHRREEEPLGGKAVTVIAGFRFHAEVVADRGCTIRRPCAFRRSGQNVPMVAGKSYISSYIRKQQRFTAENTESWSLVI